MLTKTKQKHRPPSGHNAMFNVLCVFPPYVRPSPARADARVRTSTRFEFISKHNIRPVLDGGDRPFLDVRGQTRSPHWKKGRVITHRHSHRVRVCASLNWTTLLLAGRRNGENFPFKLSDLISVTGDCFWGRARARQSPKNINRFHM